MIFLQTSSEISQSNNMPEGFSFLGISAFEIELFILIVIIIVQIYRFVRIRINIYEFKNIFETPLRVNKGYIEKELLRNNTATIEDVIFEESEDNTITDQIVDDDIVKITLINTSSINKVSKRVKKNINNYLLNNYGANVNFSIIKDMIDREVDVKDEGISQSIPTPLYLGLAATMSGIIFGLMSMPDINGGNFTEGINALINGVKWAMGASLLGLALTTYLSTISYKEAKQIILKAKNEQLSYLQAELLPELIRAEDTGVSGLKASLDHFAREATIIVNNVKIAALNTGENIKAQQDVLERVERLKVTRVTKASLELFDRLDNNMKAFNKFSKNVSIIDDISKNLKEFASRTVAIDSIASHINSSMDESKELTRFLTAHFEKIESAGNEALKAVDYSDSHFREAIDKLTKEIVIRISKMNENADNHDSQLREVYEKIGENLKTITSGHINEFKSVYADAVPQFHQLNHLKTLNPIQESIDANFSKNNMVSNNILGNIHEIKENLDNANTNNKSLENVINELSMALTGKGSETINERSKLKNILKSIELPLQIMGWILIISIAVFTILSYFKVIN